MKSIDATFNVETHSVGKQTKSLLLERCERFSENLREQEFRYTKNDASLGHPLSSLAPLFGNLWEGEFRDIKI